MGDFSGRGARGLGDASDLGDRPRVSVDRDDLEERLGGLGVEVRLGTGEEVRIRELDDFEPDAFLARLESFEELLDLRRRLGNPSTFAEAAREVQSWAETGAETGAGATAEPGSGASGGPEDVPEGIALPDDLLAAALEQTEQAPADEPESGDRLAKRLAQEFLAPHVIPAADPRLPDLLEAVDAGLRARAVGVLADPEFRAAELAWRCVDALVRRLETGPGLGIRLLDATHRELLEASAAGSLPRLGGGTDGAAPDLVLVLHRFRPTASDLGLLAALGERAGKDGARVLADAHPLWVGCESEGIGADPDDWGAVPAEVESAWESLRASHGSRLGLVLNRTLIRAPYGPRGASCERVQMDELEGGRAGCPFGSGAWALALGACEAALAQGGRPGSLDGRLELERMPVALVEEHGEVVQVAGAEAFLGDRAVGELRARGFNALRSVRGSDSVIVGPIVGLDGEPMGFDG